MNAPKLPPLPTPFRRSGQQIAEDGNDKVFCDLFSSEQMQAHYLKGYNDAIAASTAQSVPDVWRDALQRIADWNSHAVMLGVEHGSNGVRDFYRQIAIDALASAPPAPQCAGDPGECAYNGACMYACGLKDPPAPQSEELVPWKARALQAEAIVAKFMAPQAAVVQQEPFAYYQPECHQNIMEAKWRDREASRSDNSTMIAFAKACTEPLYTHHAQQAKPQPLSDEHDRALCEAYCNTASDEYFNARPQLDSAENRRIFYSGHRKAWIEWQAAHGIKE